MKWDTYRRSRSAKSTLIVWIGGLFFCLWGQQFSFCEEIRYVSGDRRDPFLPVKQNQSVDTVGSGPLIEGIVYDPKGKSVVVIKGKAYAEGDLIDAQKIVRIESNKIVLLVNGKETEHWISASEKQAMERSQQTGK